MQKRRRENLQEGGRLHAEIVEEGELSVRRGGKRNARLVDEFAETAIGASEEDTTGGSANEVRYCEALNGSNGVQGDNRRLQVRFDIATCVDGEEKNVCGRDDNECIDYGDIEDARFQLHTVDKLDLLIDSVIGEPHVVGAVVPEEEAFP